MIPALIMALQFNVALAGPFDDAKAVLRDSELSVTFPDEEDPGIRELTVKAASDRVDAEAWTSSGRIRAATLKGGDYQRLVALARRIDAAGLERDRQPSSCKAPFRLRMRVGSWERTVFGCRGAGAGAADVSRLARELEFLLLKRTSG